MKSVFNLAILSVLFTGCYVGGGPPTTVYYPAQKQKVVVYEEPETAVVVYEEPAYSYEPYYADFCEVSYDGWEECCYDYDWSVVWIGPYEYVYEVCEYTSCVDYWYNDAWMSDVVCWYE
mgnify:FL=1|tara:strand:- start:482 stop:838 length:357 start_codon:yes stop_codon:yes gene_type:complete